VCRPMNCEFAGASEGMSQYPERYRRSPKVTNRDSQGGDYLYIFSGSGDFCARNEIFQPQPQIGSSAGNCVRGQRSFLPGIATLVIPVNDPTMLGNR